MKLNDSVSILPGVGKVREEKLNKMGINTVGELLFHFPVKYQKRGDVMSVAEAKKYGDNCSTCLTIGSEAYSARLPGGKTMTKFTAFDESGRTNVVFFNQGYLSSVFRVGQAYRFWGKIVKDKRGVYALTSPEFEIFKEGVRLPDFHPVYQLSAGITRTFLVNLIGIALESCDDIEDFLPEYIITKYAFPKLYKALCDIHRPDDYAALSLARKRFVFTELLINALAVTMAKKRRKLKEKPPVEKCDIKPLLAEFPFELTDAQKRAVNEIYADMVKGEAPMARLLAGDVGSGKTAVAEIAAYVALKSNYQVGIMAPTEILASQHYRDMKPLFEKFGFETDFLSGSQTLSEKRKVRADIKSGKSRLVIGTHSLITGSTEFNNLGLVITDEQHRFGAMQRADLLGKATAVHSLVMTATPIPRTLSLTVYGDLSLSQIDALPPGRQKTDTFVISEDKRSSMYEFIAKQIKSGRQAYIVCPSIESRKDTESGNLIDFDYKPGMENRKDLFSAVDYYAFLKESVYPDFRIGLLHGKMKGSEKDAVMSDFSDGKIDILVSTTVIEVGVNVPNASIMLVENADRFGLATLHQLRGRVGRGKYKSYCLLAGAAKGSLAEERLSFLVNSQNGFEIAEYDLQKRGPGDIFSGSDGYVRQHGESSLSLFSLVDDVKTISDAFSEAESMIQNDPELECPENIGIKSKVISQFNVNVNMIN